MHRMPFGAELTPDGLVRFRLWAPAANGVVVELSGVPGGLGMERRDGGWHELITERAHAGTNYRFRLPDGMRVPDPASRHQPVDVHGPSVVIDPAAYRWRTNDWRGRPWHEAVLYELHVGTFTPEGTFRAAIEKLDHLVALGITAVEIMPIAEFAGARNWGYDGVLQFAPDRSYGMPDDLKDFVQAAHLRSLMVILDVVYNHFGPEGNYLHHYAPQFFSLRHTPWGAAVNFDDAAAAPVRAFFVHNALYWIEEYQLDGLRLDAVQMISDSSPCHILRELAERVHSATPGRHVHLILEHADNDARLLERNQGGKPHWYAAQWDDDVNHSLHVALTGERGGYYADYIDAAQRADTPTLGRALAEGFSFQGEFAPFWKAHRGQPCAHLPPIAFISFLQNHDQVGNRAFGERITSLAPAEAVRAAAAAYLLLPQVPMLFMGEEWAAAQPFPFFCDFMGDFGNAVREGRRAEFAQFAEFAEPAARDQIPDPLALATFKSAKLDWNDVAKTAHAAWLDWYMRILARRRDSIVPLLPGITNGGRYEVRGAGAVAVTWEHGRERFLRLEANLSVGPAAFAPARGRVLWQEGGATIDGAFGPWAVRWTVDD